jgi:hypothetical protein
LNEGGAGAEPGDEGVFGEGGDEVGEGGDHGCL